MRKPPLDAGNVLVGCLKRAYDTQLTGLIEFRGSGVARAFRPNGPFAVLTARLWYGLQGTGPKSTALRKAYERLVRSRDAPDLEEVKRHLLMVPETRLTFCLSDGTEIQCAVGTLPITDHLHEHLKAIQGAGEIRIAIAPEQWPKTTTVLLQFIRGWVFASLLVGGTPEAPLRAALDADFPIVIAENTAARA